MMNKLIFLFCVFFLAFCLGCDSEESLDVADDVRSDIHSSDPSFTDKDLRALYGTEFPETWVLSSRPYSLSDKDGYSADILLNVHQDWLHWEGKQIYLAHNFKDSNGVKMYDNIVFYFDDMTTMTDGYYIYLNTLD